MKKRYRLLKDTPELKAGAIVEEKCEDGTQDFTCINEKEFGNLGLQPGYYFSRKLVMEQPEWFEEIGLLWLTIEQIKKVKELIGL